MSAEQIRSHVSAGGRATHNRKAVWRAFDRTVKKANENAREDQKLRRLSIHALRHTFAWIHLMLGVPITEVSAMLSHADVTTTLSVYSHFIRKIRTDSTSRFAAAIFNQDGHFLDTSTEVKIEEKAVNA